MPIPKVQRVIRHSEAGYGFKTTGQEQNRSIGYCDPSKQAGRGGGVVQVYQKGTPTFGVDEMSFYP